MKKKTDQISLVQQAKKRLGYTNAELAKALGKSETTIKSWLAAEGAAKRREMPESSRLLLDRLISDKPKK